MRKKIFSVFTFITALIISACCVNVNCECDSPSIVLTYSDSTMQCNREVQYLITTFNSANGRPLNNRVWASSNECSFSIPYEQNRSWVISSGSLNINDTLRIKSAAFREKSARDCCNCLGDFETIEAEINGTLYFTKQITRTY